MRILLDTHIAIWAAANKLTPEAARYIGNAANTLLFSSAVIWEIAIKYGRGRDDFVIAPAVFYSGLLNTGYQELPITGRHTLHLAALPPLHKDPFDRIMLAQAMFEGIPFLTADKALTRYPGTIIYAGV